MTQLQSDAAAAMGLWNHVGSVRNVTNCPDLMPPGAKPARAHSSSHPPTMRAASVARTVRPTSTVPATLPRASPPWSVPPSRRAAIAVVSSAESPPRVHSR